MALGGAALSAVAVEAGIVDHSIQGAKRIDLFGYGADVDQQAEVAGDDPFGIGYLALEGDGAFGVPGMEDYLVPIP
jgi:hypothetical protein